MKKPLIFNIQKFSLHDGGGIRTVVFFKGCNLKCPWCSNPESQKLTAEIMKRENVCIKCSSDSPYNCTVEHMKCPTEALKLIGRWYDIDDLVNIIMKDRIMFNSSGGGVTLSGGEVMLFPEYASELLMKLKKHSVHTAIETAGNVSWDNLESVIPYVDVVLFDFKITNKNMAKEILGADIDLIINNFKKLILNDINTIPRYPFIPGYTDSIENLETIIKILGEMNIRELHLLPFHQYGSNKYDQLELPYELEHIEVPTDEMITSAVNFIEKNGINVIVGGE